MKHLHALYVVSLFTIFGLARVSSQEIHTESNAASITNEFNSVTGWGGNTVNTSVSSEAYSGSYSIKIEADDDGWEYAEYNFPTTAGQKYRVSLYAKSDSPNNPEFHWKEFAHEGYQAIGTSWTEHTITQTATGSSSRILIYTGTQATIGNTVYIDHITITPVVDSTLPSPWSSTDVGAVAAAGSTSYNNGSFQIAASGSDIWNDQDEFHFVFQQMNGDGEIIARVVSQDNTNGWAKTGVMMRNNLTADAATALLSMHPNSLGTGSGYTLQQRDSDGTSMSSPTDHNMGPVLSTYPVYLRLVRQGSTFTAYGSATNGNWQLLGSRTVTMGTNIYVGLAVTSHNDGVISNAVIDNVSIVASGGTDTQDPTAPTVSSTGHTDTTVDLSWSGSTDNVGVTGYRIYKDGSLEASPTSSPYTVSGLTSNTTYSFTVSALDAAGNESPQSTAAPVTTDSSSGGGGGSSVWSESGSIASYTGEVGIGTSSVPPGYKLAVDGNIRTREIRVDQDTWPDYVFEEGYDLPSLEEIQKHIDEKGHLPNIPSAQEVKANGVALGEMDKLLLEKIEELTLYVIQLKCENQKQQIEIEKIKSKK